MHPVLGADAGPLAGAVQADVVEGVAALDQLGVVADNGPTLAAGNHLARLKTETPQVAEGAAFLALELGQMRLGGVFDHLEVVLLGHGH